MGLDFLILYEHIVREFENDCLIAAELKKRGYSVELTQLMSRKRLGYFLWKKPRVIVTSAMYDNKTLNSFVYNNVGRLNKVINLHWEEVLSREQEQSEFYSLKQNAALCAHICWGEAARRRIMAHGVDGRNAVVTGAVQLDFFLERFRGYFKDKETLGRRFGLDASKNWILYISSFSCASMDDGEIEELNAMTSLDFRGFQQTGARSMKVTLEWIDRLLTDRPDNIFIYRPHPSEWESVALSEMRVKHENFRVISELSVKEWILACGNIFTWMSTSAAEIYFAKKNCVVVRPEPLYSDYDPVVYEGCDAADSYEKLLGRLDNPPPGFPLDEEKIKEHYSFIENRPAYERVADLCEEIYKNDPVSPPFSKGFKPKFSFLKFAALIGLNLMVTLGIRPRRFRRIFGEGVTSRADRLMGYIEKSRVKKRDIEAKIAELGRFIA